MLSGARDLGLRQETLRGAQGDEVGHLPGFEYVL